MIPKQLFFIWVGNDVPNYANFCVDTFKKVNPDFKINFLKYTIDDIENLDDRNVTEYDEDVKRCIKYVNKRNISYTNIIKHYVDNHRKFCQILVNILRLELLNNYGGIYLDCDTFPLKPFDNSILSLDNFCAYSFRKSDCCRIKNCNFIGKSLSKERIYAYWMYSNFLLVDKYKYNEDPNWKERRQKFYDCTLDYIEENCEQYVDHFYDGTWRIKNGKCRTPICKYDKI